LEGVKVGGEKSWWGKG
jgi:putative transposon-encoded protein